MKKAFFSIALAALTVASCSRDNDDSTPIPNQEQTNPNLKLVKDLDASNASEWKYFSFANGTIVQVANPSTDLTWDIAFNRYNIRTNGGTSGSGQGGVIRTESKNLSEVTSVPSGTYTADEMKTTHTYANGRPTSSTTSLNSVISGDINTTTGWWSYTPPTSQTGQPKFAVNNWVYIVKTADGKAAKIQLTSYNHSTRNTTGFITFKYQVADSNNKF